MSRPRPLPDGISVTDRGVLALLRRIRTKAERHKSHGARAAELLAERDALMAEAVARGVSWADLGRVVGCNPVTAMDAVKRHRRRTDG